MTVRVLLVEPEITIAQQISQQLQHLDCLIVGQVSDSATALASASTQQPELVILNLSLPGSIETAQQLHCPVIYITPTADEATLATAEATNPCGYLLTPFTPGQLRLSLQSALSHFRTQQQLQQILEIAHEGICFLNVQNFYTYVNQQLANSLGYTVEEMLGKSPLNFIDESNHAIARQKLNQRYQGIRDTFDIKFRHKDGSAVWMLVSANPLLDEAGNYQGGFGMMMDITQRKQTEMMLQNLVAGTAATVGEDFFPALAQSLANALSVRHVLVSRYQDDQIKTLALWSDGQLQGNVCYPATTTPCYLALQDGEYHCGSCVQQSFPDNTLLTQFQAESYFSVALKSVTGETLGLICVAHDQPLSSKQYQQYRGVVDVFALRAAAELERQQVTHFLEEKTQEQAALLQAIPDLIIRFSGDGRYLDYRGSNPSLLYQSPEEVLGKRLDEVVPEKAAQILLGAIAQLQQTQSLTICQYELPTAEGISYREARLVPFQDNQVIATIRDISDLKQAELALQQQKQFIERVTEINPSIIYVYDLNTQQNIYCNRAIVDLLGYTPEEIRQYSPLNLIHPDDLPVLMAHHQRMRQLPDQEVIEYDYRIRDAQGSWRWFYTRATPFKRDETGQVYQFLGTTADVTARKQAEEEVRQTRNFLETIINHLPVAVFVKKVKPETFGVIELWNKACQDITGVAFEEIVGKTDYCFFPPDQAEIFEKQDREVVASGQVLHILEEPIDSHTLGRRLLHTVKVPIFNEEQQPEHLLCISQDITERKTTEKALRRSEERFRTSVENLLDGFAIFAAIWDETGKIVDFRYEYINEAGCQLMQHPRQEILGNTLCTLLPNHRETELFEEYARVVETGEPLVKELFDYEDYYGGQYLRRAFSFQAVKLGKGFVVTWREVTNQRQAQVALEGSEARLKYLLSASPTPIYCSQVTGNWDITYVSSNVEELFGYPAREFLQPSFWRERVHPDDLESALEGLAQIYTQESTTLEYRFLHQNGEYHWVRDDLKMIFDAQGEPLECVGCWLDITQQKQAQMQLQASLQEKEVLLKEIHHRVKNNLQIIQSLLRLQSAYIDDPQTLQMFRDSQSRIRSMALIHEHLYRSENLAQIDFAQYIRNLTQSLFRAYCSSEPVRLDLKLVPAQISLDTALPCGLIINELVSNALKYAFKKGYYGIIEVKLQREATGQFILTVADNGVGLPEHISPQTTESLGLQLVSDCTRQLEGKLQLERGNGTRFIISFYGL